MAMYIKVFYRLFIEKIGSESYRRLLRFVDRKVNLTNTSNDLRLRLSYGILCWGDSKHFRATNGYNILREIRQALLIQARSSVPAVKYERIKFIKSIQSNHVKVGRNPRKLPFVGADAPRDTFPSHTSFLSFVPLTNSRRKMISWFTSGAKWLRARRVYTPLAIRRAPVTFFPSLRGASGANKRGGGRFFGLPFRRERADVTPGDAIFSRVRGKRADVPLPRLTDTDDALVKAMTEEGTLVGLLFLAFFQ